MPGDENEALHMVIKTKIVFLNWTFGRVIWTSWERTKSLLI